MSRELINHREDLKRLAKDGYELEVRSGFLILHRVPYVSTEKIVKYGQLVCAFSGSGPPPDHTMYFAGEYPCTDQGDPIEAFRNRSDRKELAGGLWVDHYFSAKPTSGNYDDYHQKFRHYAQVIARYARRIDPKVMVRTGRLVLSEDPRDPFVYSETASSRADITRLSEKLSNEKIGIVGLGGTGSYILDLISKTRVQEIHLFDGDQFYQYNAFRAPGPTTLKELKSNPSKVRLYKERYEKMRRGITVHEFDVAPDNINLIDDLNLDFIFVAVDSSETRQWLLPEFHQRGLPFIDVGMGVEKMDGKLLGVIRTSFCEVQGSSGIQSEGNEFSPIGEYQRNVQIVELNALNAALAVIRWKKYREFYLDLGQEYRSQYTIDGNHMINRKP